MANENETKVRNTFMRNYVPNLPNLIAAKAESMIQEAIPAEMNHVYYKQQLDTSGNLVSYENTLRAINDKGEWLRDGEKQKEVTKSYKIPGGDITVKYAVFKDTETNKEVIRPRDWEGATATQKYLEHMEGVFKLMADIYPIEAMFRANIEMPNLDSEYQGWVGRNVLDAMAGLTGDVTGKLKPEEVSSLLRFSRCQMILALDASKTLYNVLLNTMAKGGATSANLTVDLEAVVSGRLNLVEEASQEIRQGDTFKSSTSFRQDKSMKNIALSQPLNGASGGFKFGKK